MRRQRAVAAILAIALGLTTIGGVVWAAEAEYTDGRYIGISDESRGYVMAVVTITDGELTNVRLTEFTQYGVAKGEDYRWDEWHEAMEVLPDRFVEAGGIDIDGVAGATSTVNKAKQAVERALLKASDPGPGTYFDGRFFGRSPADDHGYGTAVVTIEDDEIVAVELNEVVDEGQFKDWETYPHETTVEGRGIMAERFVEAGGPDVDIVTGSTGSSEKWIKAVENALNSAAK